MPIFPPLCTPKDCSKCVSICVVVVLPFVPLIHTEGGILESIVAKKSYSLKSFALGCVSTNSRAVVIIALWGGIPGLVMMRDSGFCAKTLLRFCAGCKEFPKESKLSVVKLSSSTMQGAKDSAMARFVFPNPKSINIIYLIFSVKSATRLLINATIQNRTMILLSLKPFSSKWWCKGAIKKIFLPRVL